MYNLAQKCIQLKPVFNSHKLSRLLVGVLGENTEVMVWIENVVQTIHLDLSIILLSGLLIIQVVLAECSKEFGPW